MPPKEQQKPTAVQTTPKETPLVHNLEPMQKKKVTINIVAVVIGLVIIGSGVATGYVLAGSGSSGTVTKTTTGANGEKITTTTATKIVGEPEEKGDSAEGTLLEGGTSSGEGTAHLERPGGISQTVYLTSSTIDLSEFYGKHVKVWGQTNSAKTAGWFMDVNRLELLE